jgi:predicted nucleic acid-binding protein
VIHLDTNFLVAGLAGHSPAGKRMQAWINSETALAVSAVSWAEFLCGPIEPFDASVLSPLASLLGEPIPFTASDAEQAAILFNAAGRRKASLADCMIAATAIREGAHLATTNVSDFARFQQFGLRLETL